MLHANMRAAAISWNSVPGQFFAGVLASGAVPVSGGWPDGAAVGGDLF